MKNTNLAKSVIRNWQFLRFNYHSISTSIFNKLLIIMNQRIILTLAVVAVMCLVYADAFLCYKGSGCRGNPSIGALHVHSGVKACCNKGYKSYQTGTGLTHPSKRGKCTNCRRLDEDDDEEDFDIWDYLESLGLF
jgi:hypothetical protein